MNEYFGLLRKNSNYRLLWGGSVVSQLGDWFNLLASAELIAELSSTGVAISYLFLARFLPLFLFSPLAGVLADRYDRKRLMVAADVWRALTVACFLLVRSPEYVWLLYVLTVVQFVLSALFTPARSAVLAMVVEPQELVTANALDSLTWSSMLAMGAFLGGVVTAVSGKNTAFIIDALTFLVSAWLIKRMALSVSVPDRGNETRQWRTGWVDFRQGFQYLTGLPFMLGLSLVKGAGSLVWGAINVLEINYANTIFPLTDLGIVRGWHLQSAGTATLGLIYFVSGLGTGLGPLFVRRWWGDAIGRMLGSILLGFVLLAVGIWGLSVAPTLPFFLLATAVRTVGSGVVWVFSAALLQLLIPDRFRGRVFAFEFAFLTFTQSLSTLGAGYFQDGFALTVRQTTAVFGYLGFLMACLWAVFLLIYRQSSRLA